VLVTKYFSVSKGSNWLETNTAKPIATSAPEATSAPQDANAATTPSPTLPTIGGTNSLALSQNVDIPAIVKADSASVVGVLNQVKNQSKQSAVTDTTQGSGSGVIISTDGYIVTNNHVVSGADSLTVVLNNGEKVPAKLIGADAQTDLAVIKIDKTGLTAMPFGNSDNVQVGETVIAIGDPLGTDLAGTVTAGIISAKNRSIQIDGYTYNVLQTDAAINPGNSGGALVNSKGELIGINSSKSTSAGVDEYGQTISAEGIGFAIPVNEVKPIIEQLIKDGGISRPVIGITLREITEDLATTNQVPVGLGIVSVTDGGPAMKAGLTAGDIIVEFDGTKVETTTQMRDIINKHKVGDTVKIKVYRSTENKDMTFDITLGDSTVVNKS
jgi:serine protease Do